MERLEGFVAGSLLQRLRRPDDDLTAASCASFRGAVLFVDISGYTALAETLCSQGADGVEQLGQILDRALRGHVRAVQATGGEIACFAGDAFIAYWAADDGNIPRALRKAHDSARALHAGVAGRRRALACTAADAAHRRQRRRDLGGASRQPMSDGSCCSPGRQCDKHVRRPFAPPRARRWSHRTPARSWRHLTMPWSRARVPDARGSALAPPLDLTAHVPRRVQDYVGEGYTAWIPQRRTICALFVRDRRIGRSCARCLEPPSGGRHLASRRAASLHGCERHAAARRQGTRVHALPRHAPRCPRRRCRARGARRPGDSFGTVAPGPDCAIGIAAGAGVCMPLGGPERRHYWSVGRFMHVAGRLMEAAGSGLLCTEEIADRVRRVVSLSPERPLPLKGVRWPIRAFRVHEALVFDDQTECLYGREDEQATLDQCLAAFEQGRGTVLSVVGEAGLGKTTLVDYLRQTAERRGIACLSGGAGLGGDRRRLRGLAPGVRQAAGRSAGDAPVTPGRATRPAWRHPASATGAARQRCRARDSSKRRRWCRASPDRRARMRHRPCSARCSRRMPPAVSC